MSMSAVDARVGGALPPTLAVPIVEAINVSKSFGPTIAIRDTSFKIVAGESHALVGRNGAGKSTVVSMLSGLRGTDSGEVRFDGQPAPALSDRNGWRQRVACVYQHATIIPDLSVAENLFLNRHPERGGFIDWREMRQKARDLLDHWKVAVSVDQRASSLSIEDRQLVEIARALSYGARFIILDEPTAQLDGEEIRRLFGYMKDLQAQGVTFLFISHHLQEVYDLCQTVTVLRDAKHIITAPVKSMPREQLIEAMTGEPIAKIMSNTTRLPSSRGSAVVEVSGLSGETFTNIDLTIRTGEIVGITGATSSGRSEFAEALAGLGKVTSGKVLVAGSNLRVGDVKAALDLGVGCVPKERHRQGLVLNQSIAENTTMTIAGMLGRFGFINPKRKLRVAGDAIRNLGIVTNGPNQPVSALSGGNQQKVVLARALASHPRVLVLIDPTAGVDVRSKAQLLSIVEEKRLTGMAILLASSEIEDLRLCDRVLVMHRGKIAAEFPAGWKEHLLVAAIEGIEPDVE